MIFFAGGFGHTVHAANGGTCNDSFSISPSGDGFNTYCPGNANVEGGSINYDGMTFDRSGYSYDLSNYVTDNRPVYEYDSSICNTFIVIPNDPLEEQTSATIWTASGIFGCRIDKSKNISLNNGMSVKEKEAKDKRQADRTNQQKALDHNKQKICERVEPTNIEGCKDKLQGAFDGCYDQLSQDFTKDVDNEALHQCMSDRTGYSREDIDDALNPPLNVNTTSECEVVGMGWVICQASKLLGKITDGVFVVLKELMKVPSLDKNTSGGKDLFEVWSSMRNIANVLFVILFLIVIYSQLTNAGIDNYGLKKLVPRLLVAVILVNVSYYICAILVDLSNVLGGTLKYTLERFALPVRIDFDGFNQVASAAVVVGAGFMLYMNIFALFPIIVSGLIAMFIAVILLLAREAIIIILIVVSPIAFVLNILPNTQKWFERWWGFFFMALMMYPIIAVVYAGSKIAAGIISATAPEESATQIIFAILVLGVQTIPLFIVPLIMKASGSVFERFTGVINNPNKGPMDWAKKRSNEWKDDKNKLRSSKSITSNSKSPYGRIQKSKAKRDFATKNTKEQLKGDALKNYLAQPDVAKELSDKAALGAAGASHNIPFADPNSGGTIENAKSARQKAQERIANSMRDAELNVEIEEVTAEEAVLDDENRSLKELESMAAKGEDLNGNSVSERTQAAAMKKVAKTGDVERIESLIRSLQQMEQGGSGMLRRSLADGIDASGASGHAVHLGSAGTSKIRSGEAFSSGTPDAVNKLYADANNSGHYSSGTMSSQHAQSLAGLKKAMDSGAINSTSAATLKNTAQSVAQSSRLTTRMSNSAQREISRF